MLLNELNWATGNGYGSLEEEEEAGDDDVDFLAPSRPPDIMLASWCFMFVFMPSG